MILTIIGVMLVIINILWAQSNYKRRISLLDDVKVIGRNMTLMKDTFIVLYDVFESTKDYIGGEDPVYKTTTEMQDKLFEKTVEIELMGLKVLKK